MSKKDNDWFNKPKPCPKCGKDIYLQEVLSGMYSRRSCSDCKYQFFYIQAKSIKVKRAKQIYFKGKGLYTKKGLKERWILWVDRNGVCD